MRNLKQIFKITLDKPKYIFYTFKTNSKTEYYELLRRITDRRYFN